MKQHRSWAPRARWSAVIAVVAVAAVAGTAFAATSRSSHTAKYPGKKIAQELARTKAALDKYRSVDVAKAAGYVASSPCASTPIRT